MIIPLYRTTRRRTAIRWALAIATAACVGAAPASAHPGSGIAVDRLGQIYFIDTGAGLWKIDLHRRLTHLGGPFFHWMAIDEDNRFANVRLPGAEGDITRVGTNPTLLVSAHFPLAIGRDGNLYYPSHGPGGAVQIMRLTSSGRTSVLATLAASATEQPIHDVNGLTAAPDGSLYFTKNNVVRRITMQGQVSTVANIHLASCASIPGMTASDNPFLRGLEVDAAGTVYVAASGCGSVLSVAPDGRVRTKAQVQGPWSPTAIALSGSDVYALEYVHTEVEDAGSRRAWVPRVRKISRDGRSAIIATVERR